MMTSHLSLQGQRKRFIMSDTSRRGADRASRQPDGMPSFVERLDAIDLATAAGFELPPVMIYGDDVTHVITEQDVANLLLCRSPKEREGTVRAIAGDTDFGRAQARDMSDNLRERRIVMRPSDLRIDAKDATRDLLSARTIDDLVVWSGGLYAPPLKFRTCR
jgi:malonate decarboxylase alpha subunit